MPPASTLGVNFSVHELLIAVCSTFLCTLALHGEENIILGQLEEKVPISFTEQDEEAGHFSLKACSEHPDYRTHHK